MAKGVITCPVCEKEVVVWATCEDGLHATVTIESDCPNMRNLQAFLYGKTVDVDPDQTVSNDYFDLDFDGDNKYEFRLMETGAGNHVSVWGLGTAVSDQGLSVIGYTTAFGRKGSIWRPEVGRNGGMGNGGLWSRLFAPGVLNSEI